MTDTFRDLYKTRVMVSDGAMGTMLQKHGLKAGSCPEEWNVIHPDIIQGIHQQYYASGSDLVETNTFGANRYRLSNHGLGEKVREFNLRAAELACAVRPSGKFVAGSVGPTGEFLEPLGNLKMETLVEAFQEQMEALCRGGIDLMIIETMSDLQEALAALRAAKNIAPALPVAVTMTFEKGPTGFRTMMGNTCQDMISILSAEGADLIGANCGFGMEEMVGIMTELRAHTPHPLIAQANAGMPQWDGQKNIYTETPMQRGKSVYKLLRLDVKIVGGCCGTTPEHIKAIRESVDAYFLPAQKQ
jgi:5-methyltetrahydrofolate--homocysteine methyltransferase